MQRIAAIIMIIISMSSICYGADALCFNCGEIHQGVLSPCDKCGFQADVTNSHIWTAFSDNFMERDSLKQFGEIVKNIAEYSNDFEERLWVFLKYLVEKRPELGILDPKTVKIPDQYKSRVDKILENITNKPKKDLEKR